MSAKDRDSKKAALAPSVRGAVKTTSKSKNRRSSQKGSSGKDGKEQPSLQASSAREAAESGEENGGCDDGTQIEQLKLHKKNRAGSASGTKSRSSQMKKPPRSTTDDCGEHYNSLMKEFVVEAVKTGVAKLAKDFNDTRAASLKQPIPRTAFDKNMGKNRYKDVICSDEGRVVLKWPPGNANDYIHANWVPVRGEKKYICTQGPTEKTVEDFWRLVWQEKCKMILMLCGIMETGKKKCEQYWPAKMGQSMTSGLIAIKNLKQTDTEKSCTSSTLELTCQGERLKVEHVFWHGWPDRGVPENYMITLRLIKRTIGMAPILVHCSAGIGRTGTIVGLDMCQQMMNASEKVNMHEIVKELRKYRHGSVQTDVQFIYMHRVLFCYAENKKIITREEFPSFYRDFDAFVKAKGG